MIDLHLARERAAAAAHRLLPAERASGIVGSLQAGDGLVVVALDDLAALERRAGRAAVESVVAAAGVHLLNGTRPPGDLVAAWGDGRFLLVLRALKAPVEAVTQRLLEGWVATRPSTTVSVGAALHLDQHAPIATLERAQDALASAQRVGGGQVHVAQARP